MTKPPYVHFYTDALEDLPILARGSNAAVFCAIGLLLPTCAEGPTAKDLIKATGLSARTVEAALTHLILNGLVTETSGGNFTPTKHIDYRRNTHIVCHPVNESINRQSNQSNQSSSSVPNTEEEFGRAYRALDAVCILGGKGMTPMDTEAFKELWSDYPDPALHKRALDIMQRKAARPNFKYYVRVVESGAVDYDASKNPEAAEVML